MVRVSFEVVHRTTETLKTPENARKHAKNTLSKMLDKQTFSPVNARPTLSRRFSVAPMMDWTDRHCRFFLRLLSKHALLYTEMVTTGAILHGDHDRFLRHNEAEDRKSVV